LETRPKHDPLKHQPGFDMKTTPTARTETTLFPGPSAPTGSSRLVALDAFRGAIIALMVLVNDPGGPQSYGPLNHADWHGWTITDVVFPSFVWIIGVAITLALAKRLEAGVPRTQLFAQILRRGAILYALGLLLYLFPRFDFSTMRVLGVLQRLAICYVVASLIYLTTSIRGQIIWIVSLLSSYWLLMALVPVPGCGAGQLNVECNLAHYVDRIVLGQHNYHSTKTWDPEGIVSTLPAIATALFGIMAGHILRLKRDLAERTTWLFFAGSLLLGAGLICDMWLPINKKLWTSSFALFMAGLDFILFAIFLWWIDGLGRKRMVKPLVIMGMNAIAVYMASELLDITLGAIHVTSGGTSISLHAWIYQNVFAPIASPANASLLYALAYVGLMYVLAYGMYRRRWFIRV
jgi:predicted acyltransferase